MIHSYPRAIRSACFAFSLMALLASSSIVLSKVVLPSSDELEESSVRSHGCKPCLSNCSPRQPQVNRCNPHIISHVPYIISEPGYYKVISDQDVSSGAGITVNAENVCIELCCGVHMRTAPTAVAIQANRNNILIQGGVFLPLNAELGERAIVLANGIKEIAIVESTFHQYEEAIAAQDFSDLTLTGLSFFYCDQGFQQDANGAGQKFLAEGIRANHDKLSYAISLNGKVSDSTITNCQLVSSSLYCHECKACSVNEVEIDYPDVQVGPFDWAIGIQCGGPRGNGLFTIRPDTPRLGCSACEIFNCRVRMVSGRPDEITFIVGIVSVFCTACNINRCRVVTDGGPSRAFGVGILESYCISCSLRDCQTEGPCLISTFICDFLDINVPCFATLVENCKVRNSWFGLTMFRCRGGVIKNAYAQQCEIGILVSDGASDTIVNNIECSQNTIGFQNSILSPAFMPFPPSPVFVPDPFLAPPVNTLLINSNFVGNGINFNTPTPATIVNVQTVP